MQRRSFLKGLALCPLAIGCSQTPSSAQHATTASPSTTPNSTVIADPPPPLGERLVLSEEQWRSRLTPAQFDVLRDEGTERAYSGATWDEHRAGTYYCAGCGAPLFAASNKFESGTGWPSFTTPITDGRVSERTDGTLGMLRTEVLCARCDGHLGHVFSDGPQPTGQRYCINSMAMLFQPED